MATVGSETSREQREPPKGLVYDGFISYGHAADDLLAPRLQAGLQRFAKPWWRRRALRIFRDEASLSANPHLWSSITTALDQSAWFVLLLSPEAAESPWVNNEVEYWLEHKDPDRIIPVLTDGEFGWAKKDVAGDAVPQALQGAFSDEPRWVDLRFARAEEQLDLNNPRFSAAIADVASAIRGVPKDELESEEVRQHRRTRRTALGAVVAVLLLATAAVVAAAVAVNESNEAQAQRDEARRQAEIAQQSEELAVEQQVEAERQATIAEARELAASAIAVVDRDPELALLLTLSSFAKAPSDVAEFPEGKVALRDALERHRLIALLSVSEGTETGADFTADGQGLVVAATFERTVSLIDLESGELVWTYDDPTTIDSFSRVEASRDGRLVAVPVSDVRIGGDVDTSEVSLDANGQDPFPGRVVILDAANGSVVTTVFGDGCPFASLVGTRLFSPDGSLLVLATGTEECGRGIPGTTWVSLIDTTSWGEVQRIPIDGGSGAGSVTFADDMTRLAVSADGVPLQIATWPELETLEAIDANAVVSTLSPDGETVLVRHPNAPDLRPSLWRTTDGAHLDQLDAFDGFLVDMAFSRSGDRIAAASTRGVYVWRPNGELLFEFSAPTASQVRFSPDGNSIASAHIDGHVRIWDISDPFGQPISTETDTIVWFNPDTIIEGRNTGVIGFGTEANLRLVRLDPATGSTMGSISAWWWADQLPDGRFVVVPWAEDESTLGSLAVWDPDDGSVEVVDECVVGYPGEFLSEPVLCPDGSPLFGQGVVVSQDGTRFGAGALVPWGEPMPFRFWDASTLEPLTTIEIPTSDRIDWGTPFLDDDSLVLLEGDPGGQLDSAYRVYNPDTGELLATLDQTREWRGASVVTADGRRLFAGSQSGEVWEYDTDTWAPSRSWQAQDGRLRGLALSPDESQLASTGEDGHVMIWDLDSLQLVDRIPLPFPSDAMWIDEDTLAVTLATRGEWAVVTVRNDELLDAARAGLTRSYTVDECRLYNIDPCPTLEEIKAGTR
jgi:WD40 repeat protein